MGRTYLPSASHALLNGVSQIFLQANPVCGLLILVTISLYAPSLLLGSLLGLLSGTFTARCLGYERHDIESGLYGYNSTLLGLLITLVLGPSALALLLVALAGALSSLLQKRLLRTMREHGGPAVFTLAFVLFGWLVLAVAGMLDSVAEARGYGSSLDGWSAIGAMASGMGQVMFLGEPAAGLCLLLAVLIADRRAGLWALCGSAIGVYCALLTGVTESQALAGLAGYNPALAALALSQVHRSALMPALGIALAIVCKLVFDQWGMPALTMPFILSCWIVALGTRLTQRRVYIQPA
ncbi:urea transporter [Stutzerimonas stutzeri]|uniref:Urea transporter n=1 Tax=Stutzerimonas stutzeri TaxID=316 RepID=W8RRI0_STUST|nr:urea transporter [Stutzerimonas stutzeri]AHL74631.1 urea transporter [Stutzerimonas stutzeri]MCQ4329161.1 urea transporter [Stutzerimonas stutzeri]